MYINSTHIKMVKLIQSYKNIELKDISRALLLNDFTTRTHLKNLKDYMDLKDSQSSIQEIINEIYANKKLIYILKKEQEFTKQEKIDYLIFNLLTKDIVNLSKISKEIKVNKRGLNYYFTEIKELLSKHNLIIKNNKQGIYLKGTLNNRANLQFIFVFKLYIDKNFLPYSLKKDFFTYVLKSNLRKNRNFKKKYPELCKVLSPVVSRYTFKSFSSLYLSYGKISGNRSIKSLCDKELLKYKPNLFTKEEFFKVVNIIKLTPLGELQSSVLDLLLLALRHFTYSYKSFSKHTVDLALKIRPIVEKYMETKNINNTDYFNCFCPWIDFAFFRKHFNIFDYDYQISNLNIQSICEVDSIIEEIQKIVPLFTKLDLTIAGYMLHTKISKEMDKNKILVYDKVPNYIIHTLIGELKTVHNVEVIKSVNISEFYKNNNYNKDDYSIITLEDLDIKTELEVKNYQIVSLRKY